MPDSLKNFLDMVSTVGIFGAVIGLMRLVIQRRYNSLPEALAIIASSMVVAVLAGLALAGSSFPQTLQFAIVGLCSLVADEVLVIISTLARTAMNDPSKLRDAAMIILRGGKP